MTKTHCIGLSNNLHKIQVIFKAPPKSCLITSSCCWCSSLDHRSEARRQRLVLRFEYPTGDIHTNHIWGETKTHCVGNNYCGNWPMLNCDHSFDCSPIPTTDGLLVFCLQLALAWLRVVTLTSHPRSIEVWPLKASPFVEYSFGGGFPLDRHFADFFNTITGSGSLVLVSCVRDWFTGRHFGVEFRAIQRFGIHQYQGLETAGNSTDIHVWGIDSRPLKIRHGPLKSLFQHG